MKRNMFRLTCFVAILSSGTLIHAQTAAPSTATSASTDSPKGEEILTLEQFVVTSTAGSGYRATNSISATGIGTAIGLTPASVQVLTKELLNDTKPDLINDALRMVPGVTTQPTNESQPMIRGFQGAYTLRNGVFRRQNLTSWNIDSVEVVQGPSSIFYSNIRPGGVINYNTTKPAFNSNFADVSLTGGSYGYLRSEAAFNAGNDKLAFRADLGYLSTRSFRNRFHEGQKFLSIGVSWKITPKQLLTVEAATESVSRENTWSAYITPMTNSRYWKNPTAIASGQTVSAWMAANYPGTPVYDMYAPFLPNSSDPYGRQTPVMDNSYQSGLDRPVDLSYVASLTDNLVFTTTANYAWENNEGINFLTGDPLANGTFATNGTQLERFVNVRDSYNLNTRLTYKFNVAGVSNIAMVGDDNQWVVQRYPQVGSLGSNGGTPVVNNANMRTAAFTFDPTAAPVNAAGLIWAPTTSQFNATRDTLQHFGGAYIVDQAVLLNKTLYLVVGDRYTSFQQHIWYPARSDLQAARAPDATYKKWTPQYGGLYKIAGGPVSVFYTHSQALVPQTQIDASGKPVTPITATGWDVGSKLDLMNGAFTGTIDYYSIQQTNTAISDNVQNAAHGLPNNATYGYYTYGNAQQIKGIQADINFNITKDYQLVLGYNRFIKDAYIAPNTNPLIVGLPINTLPQTTLSLWNRYEFTSGSVKGLVLGFGVRHNDKTIVAGGNFNVSTFYTDAFTVYDALIGYNFKVYGRPINAALNIKNLSNLIYRDAGGVWGNPRLFQLTASSRF